MFTKEQLAKWREQGFDFDDPFYDDVAVESVEENFDTTSPKNIVGYEWCDENGRSFPNGALPYGENSLAAIFSFTEKVKNKMCFIRIIHKNSKEEIKAIKFKIKYKKQIVNFDTNIFFGNCTDLISNFDIKVQVGNEVYQSTSSDSRVTAKEILKIHFVIFIPIIMKEFKWPFAVKSQDDWFMRKKNNYPWESEPRLNYFSFEEWALKFERFNKKYQDNKDIWMTSKSLNVLKNEIKKMVKDGYAEYPTEKKKLTAFGPNIMSSELGEITIKPEESNGKLIEIDTPIFDKYYFSNFTYTESKVSPDYDDFYGAVANCTVRFCARGSLQFVSPGKIMVTIRELGVYIRDGFDYVGSQLLGCWSYKEKAVTNNLLSNDTYLLVTNEDFRNYRKATGMGQDFYRFSTPMILNPNFTFQL